MTDLISRLQSATGPSRELDAEIALANGWTHQKLKPENGRGGDSRPYWRKPSETKYYIREEQGPPRYTESIDAALADVPKGLLVAITIWLGTTVVRLRTGTILDPATKEWEGSSRTTPAIAIRIAIERAKEDSKP